MTTTVAERRKTLVARRDFLLKRLNRIESELDASVSKDFEDMATEREGDEVLQDLGTAGLQELRMIDAALQRIEDGEYGFCVQCGNPIDEGRLDLLPATPFCATDAAKR